jgi:hypothetical protein
MEFIFISRLKLFTLQFTYSIGAKFIFLMASHHLKREEVQSLLLLTYIFLGVHLLYMYPKYFVRSLMLKVAKVYFLVILMRKFIEFGILRSLQLLSLTMICSTRPHSCQQLLTILQQQQFFFPQFFCKNNCSIRSTCLSRSFWSFFMTSIFHEQFLFMT